MIQKEVVAPNRVEWNALIERLEIFNTTAQYHQLLETIIVCIKIIEEGRWDCDDVKFFEGLSLLLDACKQLVGIVEEFFYSRRLGAIVLRLVEALRSQAALSGQKIVINFIEECLPYTIDTHINYKTLCNHECGSVEDFFPAHLPNPYHLLNEIHTDCLRKVQSSLERYLEAAIVTRVVDYWRTLLNTGNESGDIQPLIELGEDLLSRIKECADPKRKKVLWKVILLLQILLRDHPALKALKSQDWPAEGFVQSFLPFEYQSPSLAQRSLNKPISTLLKDYRPQLQASRLIFEDAITGKADVFKAQENHSRQVIKILEEMVLATRKLLGLPPSEIVVCILGSTSRHDRRPYSDLEYMILHQEIPVDKKNDLDLYICHFISIFELMIVSLGETSSNHNNNKNGFKIDQSLLGLTVSFKSKSWGTPEEVAKKYVIELNEPPHGWLDKGLFEYLHPIALECPELGSRALFEQYLKELDGYLNQGVKEGDSPQVITQRFKITRENWWKELTRRQGIALASLCEVVHSNENMYLNIDAGRIINLKTFYYKPLLYCALSLGMYEGAQALTPSKTIEAYCARMPWGGEALLLWWKAALRYVVKEQVKQHLIGGCQQDSMMVSEDACWAGFDLIVEGFILPLQKGVWECLLGSLPISMLGYVILKGYLNARHAWLEKWQDKRLERFELLNHPLIQILISYPDESGRSPQTEVLLNNHYGDLLELSTDRITACEFAGLPVKEKKTTRYLNEKIIQECFKGGGFVGDPELSSERSQSQVKKVMVGGKSWYIKVKQGNLEGLMAREYLAMLLHLYLGGKPQVALGWPVQLRSEYQGQTKYHYAWVSEGIEGDSLGKVMLESPGALKAKNLDPESFTQLFLFTYLICPEDGQPENFKVIIQEGKARVVAIDYGQCFVQLKRMAGFFKNKEALGMKTMIYLLESMDEDLSSDFITRLRLLDIDRWFQSWVGAAQFINGFFKPLFEKDLTTLAKFKQSAAPLCLIDIEDGLMFCVKKRLELLQYWLRTTDERITGRNILRACDRLVYLHYESLRGTIKTPNDFYEKLDKDAYEKSDQGKIISSLSMKKIKEGTMTVASLAQSCDLEASYFRRVNFGKLSKEDQQFTLELLEAVAARKGGQFFQLDLSGAEIDENKLIELLEKMMNLEVLNLTDSKGIGVMTVAKLLAHRPETTVYALGNKVLCPQLQMITMKVEGELCELMLHLSFEERHLLTIKMRNFDVLFERVVRGLFRKFPASFAVKVLDQIGVAEDRVIDAILKKIEDSDRYVRSVYMELAGEFGKPNQRVIEALLKALEGSIFDHNWKANKEVRVAAVKALGQLGKAEDRVVEAVVKAGGETNWDSASEAHGMCIAVAKALGQLGTAENRVMVALLDTLEDPRWFGGEVLAVVAQAFGQLGRVDFSVIDALLVLIGKKSYGGGLIAAVEALGQLGEELGKIKDGVLESLLKALENYHMGAKEELLSTAELLKRLGRAQVRVIDALLVVLSESKPEAGARVIKALGQLGGRLAKTQDRVVEALLTSPENSPWEAKKERSAAADVLSQLEKAKARIIEALMKGLGDSDWTYYNLRGTAITALEQLGVEEKSVIEMLLKGLAASEGRDIKLATDKQIRRADEQVMKGLMVGLGHLDKRVSSCAIKALERLDVADQLVDELLKVLEDSHWEAKIKCNMVAAALGQLGKAEDRVIEVLLRMLENPEWTIVSGAAEALSMLGKAEDRVIHGLSKALEYSNGKAPAYVGDSDHGYCVRVSVIASLERLRIGEDRLIWILMKAMNNMAGIAPSSSEILERKSGLDDRTVEQSLLKALGNSDRHVRRFAIEILKRLEHEDRVIEVFLKALKNSDPFTCLEAAKALGRLLTPKNCWKRIQQEISEVRLGPAVRDSQPKFSSSFFKKELVQSRIINAEFLEYDDLNKAALASQREIVSCESDGIHARCRVIPVEPDGDCGFTGTRRVLDLMGQSQIASKMTRAQMISLVRDEFVKELSLCKPIILQIFNADGIINDDENEALEQWCGVFARKGYWMQEPHFRFLSKIFNIEFCFFHVDDEKNFLKPELGNESLYEGGDRETKIQVNLLHMTITLRSENAQLNHFDGFIINPTLEQVQRIDFLLGEVLSEEWVVLEKEGDDSSRERENLPRW